MLTEIAYLTGAAQAAASSLMAVTIATILVRGLPLGSPTRGAVIAWGLLIAPAAVPNILVGYVYSPFLLPLVHHPFGQSAVYSFLVASKSVPALALVLTLLPPTLPPSGRHALTLSPRSYAWKLGFLARSSAPNLTVASALGFILAFNEFEIASILGVHAWSVSVFDAHAGGLPTSESIRLALSTLAVQSPALIIGLLALRLALRHGRGIRVSNSQKSSPALSRASWVLLASVSTATAFLPLTLIAAESAQGLLALQIFPLAREIFASLYLATAASCLVLLLSNWLVSHRSAALAVSAPCLTGSLLIGLAVLAFFQSPPLSSFRLGPLPAIIALALNTLPASLALRFLVTAAARKPAAHAARLSPSRPLRWRYLATPTAGVAALVFLWIYYDVAITSLLSPPGMTTAFERLHNLMHYGRTTALSAMVVIAFLAPIVVILSAWAATRTGFLLRPRSDRGTVTPSDPPPPPPDA